MRRTPFGQTSARFRTDRQAKELPGRPRCVRRLGGVISYIARSYVVVLCVAL